MAVIYPLHRPLVVPWLHAHTHKHTHSEKAVNPFLMLYHPFFFPCCQRLVDQWWCSDAWVTEDRVRSWRCVFFFQTEGCEADSLSAGTHYGSVCLAKHCTAAQQHSELLSAWLSTIATNSLPGAGLLQRIRSKPIHSQITDQSDCTQRTSFTVLTLLLIMIALPLYCECPRSQTGRRGNLKVTSALRWRPVLHLEVIKADNVRLT